VLDTPVDQRFHCDVLPERGTVRVALAGEFDMAATAVVQTELDHLLDAGFQHVVLDLRELTFLDSSGLRLIVTAKRTARERDLLLDILPGPPLVQRIFEMTGTDAVVFD
jgi:anti-anti-sigma factor